MTDLPGRDGPAARLACLMHERGMSASIRTADSAFVVTIRNPAVPSGRLAQTIAHVPGNDGGVFLWLFEGPERGTWEAEPLCPASDVETAADQIARVLAITEQADGS